MKIKIVSAKLDTYWYADKIGEVYEVLESNAMTNDDEYRVDNPEDDDVEESFVNIFDCEVVG